MNRNGTNEVALQTKTEWKIKEEEGKSIESNPR